MTITSADATPYIDHLRRRIKQLEGVIEAKDGVIAKSAVDFEELKYQARQFYEGRIEAGQLMRQAENERDELEVENAALASQLAKMTHERDELEKRAHDLGNRCLIAEGQRDVLHDALGIALMGGKDGELAWAREVYRRTQAGDDIGVLMSNIQRMAAEIRRHKAAATGDTR